MVHVHLDETRTLYGFVADERATGRRYIVFRGTQQPAEWVRNAQAGQRPYPSERQPGPPPHTSTLASCKFLRVYSWTRARAPPRCRPPALRNLVAGRDTVFVGHSLGSALATLAGVEASRRSPKARARACVSPLLRRELAMQALLHSRKPSAASTAFAIWLTW
ncbi:MAG: hypothetical protein IPG56_16695 [Caulobacteraceae bacterium]|nr:hypothetical protein [Caulobacteraceae bacterium]